MACAFGRAGARPAGRDGGGLRRDPGGHPAPARRLPARRRAGRLRARFAGRAAGVRHARALPRCRAQRLPADGAAGERGVSGAGGPWRRGGAAGAADRARRRRLARLLRHAAAEGRPLARERLPPGAAREDRSDVSFQPPVEAPARSVVAPSAVWRGRAHPLGATWDGAGVNFALFSKNAERVELCLFEPRGRREIERVDVRERTDFVWHCYLPEARPGLLYGYRVHGANEGPHRFDASRILLDPYAKLIQGKIGAGLGRSQVVDTAFSWGDDRPPRTGWRDTVVYELHVKGFTQRHPRVPEQLRGTYAGLSTAPVVDYLRRLGVTAVELLPIHAFVDERRLVQQGLKNYWGYNSIGFFAPELRYSATGTLGEFKTMVKTLHAAGIEVILDVVYNHTAEGDHTGPTLSFRGLDNSVYYRLDPSNPRRYLNFTGTGNSLNSAHRVVLGLIMDSLRYWVQEMHVDGFRFDLAPTLARNATHAFDRNGAFL